MLYPLKAGQVRVRGRVRVTMSIGTKDILRLKTIEFQISAKISCSRFLLTQEN